MLTHTHYAPRTIIVSTYTQTFTHSRCSYTECGGALNLTIHIISFTLVMVPTCNSWYLHYIFILWPFCIKQLCYDIHLYLNDTDLILTKLNLCLHKTTASLVSIWYGLIIVLFKHPLYHMIWIIHEIHIIYILPMLNNGFTEPSETFGVHFGETEYHIYAHISHFYLTSRTISLYPTSLVQVWWIKALHVLTLVCDVYWWYYIV